MLTTTQSKNITVYVLNNILLKRKPKFFIIYSGIICQQSVLLSSHQRRGSRCGGVGELDLIIVNNNVNVKFYLQKSFDYDLKYALYCEYQTLFVLSFVQMIKGINDMYIFIYIE